ncbi:MAG: DUF1622 domain-containing protein [Chloroflexi bacterium]|nr:DUF1622 domain-containing protein [Chloroflexota bacterium]
MILIGSILATVRFAQRLTSSSMHDPYWSYKVEIGRALLLGLEILVAADIIKTVALEPTFASLGVLGGLVVIRTFLSWTLVLEIEGRWPWQREHTADTEEGE